MDHRSGQTTRHCTSANSPGRIPFLDGIRGYASLWVMLGHFSTRSGFSVPILYSPNIAVDLFMIVSGFLMTQHFFVRQAAEPWGSPRTWLIFYLRRFFRIAPLYYVLLIPSFLAFQALRDAQRGPLKMLVNVDYHPPAIGITAANILAHVSFLFGLFPQYSTILTMPDWSLSLEMQFYAVFPFLMLLARRWNIFRLCLLALPLWGLFRKFNALPSFLPVKLGLFLIGMLLAWAWAEQDGKLTARACILLLLAVAFSGMAGSGVIVIGVTILLALLLFYNEESMGLGLGSWLQRISNFLGNRVSHFLANVSYGVYLLHLLVMVPLLALLCDLPWFVRQPALARFLLLTITAGPITYALAWLLFRWIETPGIRLGKILINRLFRSSVPAQDSPMPIN